MPTKPALERAANREMFYGLSFFALLWMVIGFAGYQAFPVIACVSEQNSNGTEICRSALNRSFVPHQFRSQARQKLVELLVAQENHEDVLKVIDEAQKENDLSVVLILNRGYALRDLGKADEAISTFRTLLKVDPTHEDAMNALLWAHLGKDKFDDARLDAQAFIMANPSSWRTMGLLGWVEYRAGKPDAAIENYARAITINPTEYWLLSDMGEIHQSAGDLTKSIAAYTKLVEAWPEDRDVLMRRGRVYDEAGNYALAQGDYLKALQSERDHDTLVTLGRSYSDSENFEKAAAIFDEAMTLDGLSEWGHASKVRMLYQQKRYADAKIAIEKLKRIAPDSVHAMYWKASVDDEEERNSVALSGFEKVLQSWEDDFDTLIDMGHVLVDLERPAESLVYFNRAVEARQKSALALSSRARGHLWNKNWAAAVADADKSILFKPKQFIAYARRASAEAELGMTDKARIDYATAIESEPSVEWVQRENLNLLIKNNLLADAKLALQKARASFPGASFVLEYEASLRQKGVAFP